MSLPNIRKSFSNSPFRLLQPFLASSSRRRCLWISSILSLTLLSQSFLAFSSRRYCLWIFSLQCSLTRLSASSRRLCLWIFSLHSLAYLRYDFKIMTSSRLLEWTSSSTTTAAGGKFALADLPDFGRSLVHFFSHRAGLFLRSTVLIGRDTWTVGALAGSVYTSLITFRSFHYYFLEILRMRCDEFKEMILRQCQ